MKFSLDVPLKNPGVSYKMAKFKMAAGFFFKNLFFDQGTYNFVQRHFLG
jgi:hypothetical protein